jgi:ubiquinone/menaquinone biosynthesis C-methylase UbiE
LDVGCGPGVLLPELLFSTPAPIHGADLNRLALKEAQIHAPAVALACADAHALPYPAQTFDITLCHYLLLWVRDPLKVLREMKRVTSSGGYVLALAEPDYTQREDSPPAMAQLGRWQTRALQQQGANPQMGARLQALFAEAGINLLESGILAKREHVPLLSEEWEMEKAVLIADLTGIIPSADIQKNLQNLTCASVQTFVPTHFAVGQV